MKFKIGSLAAALLAFAAAISPARAQSTSAAVQDSSFVRHGERGMHRARGHRKANVRRALFRGITLTADQKTRIKAIHSSYRSQFQSLRAQRVQGAAPDSARKTRVRALRAQELAQIRGVLSADQQSIFDRNSANLREHGGRNRSSPRQRPL